MFGKKKRILIVVSRGMYMTLGFSAVSMVVNPMTSGHYKHKTIYKDGQVSDGHGNYRECWDYIEHYANDFNQQIITENIKYNIQRYGKDYAKNIEVTAFE